MDNLSCSKWGCRDPDSDTEDFKAPVPKVKGKATTDSKRFVEPTYTVDLDQICQGFVPKSTRKATVWVVKVFEWRLIRNRATSDDGEKCPANLLECPMHYWLSRMESRILLALFRVCWLACTVNARSKPYPPSTISSLLAGLYRECQKYIAIAPTS